MSGEVAGPLRRLAQGLSGRTPQDREQGRPPGSLGRRAHPLADRVHESGGSAQGGLTLTRSPVAGPASRYRSRPIPGGPASMTWPKRSRSGLGSGDGRASAR